MKNAKIVCLILLVMNMFITSCKSQPISVGVAVSVPVETEEVVYEGPYTIYYSTSPDVYIAAPVGVITAWPWFYYPYGVYVGWYPCRYYYNNAWCWWGGVGLYYNYGGFYWSGGRYCYNGYHYGYYSGHYNASYHGYFHGGYRPYHYGYNNNYRNGYNHGFPPITPHRSPTVVNPNNNHTYHSPSVTPRNNTYRVAPSAPRAIQAPQAIPRGQSNSGNRSSSQIGGMGHNGGHR